MSLRSRTLPSRSGPKDETLARTWAPTLPDSDRISSGWPAALKATWSDSQRLTTLGLAGSPGAPTPERSPFTSTANTGTPAAESWPARSWRVFVLPVPVAPAISPWRLIRDSGTWTRTLGRTSSPMMGEPNTMTGSSKA